MVIKKKYNLNRRILEIEVSIPTFCSGFMLSWYQNYKHQWLKAKFGCKCTFLQEHFIIFAFDITSYTSGVKILKFNCYSPIFRSSVVHTLLIPKLQKSIVGVKCGSTCLQFDIRRVHTTGSKMLKCHCYSRIFRTSLYLLFVYTLLPKL